MFGRRDRARAISLRRGWRGTFLSSALAALIEAGQRLDHCFQLQQLIGNANKRPKNK
jgi:hypothetical protein